MRKVPEGYDAAISIPEAHRLGYGDTDALYAWARAGILKIWPVRPNASRYHTSRRYLDEARERLRSEALASISESGSTPNAIVKKRVTQRDISRDLYR